MGSIKIKLVASLAGRPLDQKQTAVGLGLSRFGQERILADTPAIRGMVAKLQHMVSMESSSTPASKRNRRRSKPAAQATK